MSYEISIQCFIEGNTFYPNNADTLKGLHFEIERKKGEIYRIGKSNISRQSIIGIAEVSLKESPPEQNDALDYFVTILSDNIQNLYACGAETFSIVIGIYYVDQCNFSFSSSSLKKNW